MMFTVDMTILYLRRDEVRSGHQARRGAGRRHLQAVQTEKVPQQVQQPPLDGFGLANLFLALSHVAQLQKHVLIQLCEARDFEL